MSIVYLGVSVWTVQRLSAPTVPSRSLHAEDAAGDVVGSEAVVAGADFDVVGGVVMASEDAPDLVELPHAVAATRVRAAAAITTFRVVMSCSGLECQPSWTVSRETKK